MDFLYTIKNFEIGLFINYFLNSYYFVILIILIGLYTLVNTIKHPTEDGWDSSPLQENWRGIIVGLGSIVFGVLTIYWLLSDKDYPWMKDIDNPIWDKYTALTILTLSLGRLLYLFLFENFREKEKFRLIIVLVCCVLLIITSVYNLWSLI